MRAFKPQFKQFLFILCIFTSLTTYTQENNHNCIVFNRLIIHKPSNHILPTIKSSTAHFVCDNAYHLNLKVKKIQPITLGTKKNSAATTLNQFKVVASSNKHLQKNSFKKHILNTHFNLLISVNNERLSMLNYKYLI